MPIQKETACKGKALLNIEYILNPSKTADENGRRWVATYNMISNGLESAKELYQEFEDVNMLWKKNNKFDERKYYHTIVNFKGNEGATPEIALDTGFAYLKKFFANHQAILAIHIHEDEIHLHMCINSIDMETGYKVNRTNKDMADRKDFVNEYAYEKYGIEPFDWKTAVKTKREKEKAEKLSGKMDNYNYAEQQMHESGRTSELDMLRARILRTALSTKNRQEFEERLKQEYEITMPRNTNNTISYKYKDGRTIRGNKLGDRYTAEYIDKIFEYNRYYERKRLYESTELQKPNFKDLDAIAKEKNYKVARQVGFTMSKLEFKKATENELVCRYAFVFIKRQKIVDFQNGIVFINGQPVQTDERLQKMYDSTVAAQSAYEKHGCENMRDLEDKKNELEELLIKSKTELRKERKIEASLKNKLNRKTALYEAAEKVYQGKGTFEEQNNAKHILYRNGIKKEQFNDPQTTEKIRREVVVAQQDLEEQQIKTKEIFFKQKELKKDLETLETVINGVGLANDLRFYYGDDFGVHIGFEQHPEHVYTSFDETDDLTVEELENKTDDLVGSVNDLLLDATIRSQKTDEGTEKDFENGIKEI